MLAGVPKESFPGERRVALVPAILAPLAKAGIEAVVESGAGESAGFPDRAYADKGGRVVPSRKEVFETADVILQVRALGMNLEAGKPDLALLRRDQALIATVSPLSSPEPIREAAGRGVTVFALELVPRITRAQNMDVLSSMATIAGYKAVLLAANALPRLFPMLVTAAGTVTQARVFVIGAGVAGLQAIATARRLGAVVEAYDVRPAVKEQVKSLGAKFVELPLDAGASEDRGGYAKALGDEFYKRQREVMTRVVSGSDVVITTAAVPGKKAPVLLTREMVAGMAPGSVVVDLAAEQGGNCEATVPGETAVVGGVTVIGPLNVPSSVPAHASQMFARNVANFLLHLTSDGALRIDPEDEIVRGSLVARGGTVTHPLVREALGLPSTLEAGGSSR